MTTKVRTREDIFKILDENRRVAGGMVHARVTMLAYDDTCPRKRGHGTH